MARPKLTAKAAKGLSSLYSVISVELESGLLARRNGGPFTDQEVDAMVSAQRYIGALLEWTEAQTRER